MGSILGLPTEILYLVINKLSLREKYRLLISCKRFGPLILRDLYEICSIRYLRDEGNAYVLCPAQADAKAFMKYGIYVRHLHVNCFCQYCMSLPSCPSLLPKFTTSIKEMIDELREIIDPDLVNLCRQNWTTPPYSDIFQALFETENSSEHPWASKNLWAYEYSLDDVDTQGFQSLLALLRTSRRRVTHYPLAPNQVYLLAPAFTALKTFHFGGYVPVIEQLSALRLVMATCLTLQKFHGNLNLMGDGQLDCLRELESQDTSEAPEAYPKLTDLTLILHETGDPFESLTVTQCLLNILCKTFHAPAKTVKRFRFEFPMEGYDFPEDGDWPCECFLKYIAWNSNETTLSLDLPMVETLHLEFSTPFLYEGMFSQFFGLDKTKVKEVELSRLFNQDILQEEEVAAANFISKFTNLEKIHFLWPKRLEWTNIFSRVVESVKAVESVKHLKEATILVDERFPVQALLERTNVYGKRCEVHRNTGQVNPQRSKLERKNAPSTSIILRYE